MTCRSIRQRFREIIKHGKYQTIHNEKNENRGVHK